MSRYKSADSRRLNFLFDDIGTLKLTIMSEGDSAVVVAVRVRPFNDREKDRKVRLVIEMPDGKTTSIK